LTYDADFDKSSKNILLSLIFLFKAIPTITQITPALCDALFAHLKDWCAKDISMPPVSTYGHS
jgi:hypothetical protein